MSAPHSPELALRNRWVEAGSAIRGVMNRPPDQPLDARLTGVLHDAFAEVGAISVEAGPADAELMLQAGGAAACEELATHIAARGPEPVSIAQVRSISRPLGTMFATLLEARGPDIEHSLHDREQYELAGHLVIALMAHNSRDGDAACYSLSPFGRTLGVDLRHNIRVVVGGVSVPVSVLGGREDDRLFSAHSGGMRRFALPRFLRDHTDRKYGRPPSQVVDLGSRWDLVRLLAAEAAGTLDTDPERDQKLDLLANSLRHDIGRIATFDPSELRVHNGRSSRRRREVPPPAPLTPADPER